MILVVNLVVNPRCKSNTNKILSVHSPFKLILEILKILNNYTVISYIRVSIRWFPSSLVTDNGFWMYVHEALSAVYQAEAFEWELHGFWPICSDFLHNCCLMISLQIPGDRHAHRLNSSPDNDFGWTIKWYCHVKQSFRTLWYIGITQSSFGGAMQVPIQSNLTQRSFKS